MKLSIRFLSLAITVAFMVPTGHAAAPNKVFRVNATLQGRIQSEDRHGNPVLLSEPAQTKALINLALGNDVKATVPANLVLAARVTCGEGISQLVVWDTNGSSNFVVIATIDSNAAIAAKTKAEFIALLDVQNVGNGTNGITGGLLLAAGKATITTNDLCATKATATVSGVVDATVSDDTGAHSVRLLVPKGTVTTQGPAIAP